MIEHSVDPPGQPRSFLTIKMMANVDMGEILQELHGLNRQLIGMHPDVLCEHVAHFISRRLVETLNQKENLMHNKFGMLLNWLFCLVQELALWPGFEDIKHLVRDFLRDSHSRALANLRDPQPPVEYSFTTHTFQLRTVLFRGKHLGCYGHALLDNVYSLWARLSTHGQLHCPLAILMFDIDRHRNIAHTNELIHIIAPAAVVDWEYQNFPPADETIEATPASWWDPVLDAIIQDMSNVSAPHVPDQLYASTRRSASLFAYVDYIVRRLGLEQVRPEAGLVTLVLRTDDRLMLNHDDVRAFLENRGYRVEVVYFTAMSLREQVRQARRSSILLSSYGSNMANTVFMHPGTQAVICYPNPDVRKFLAGKYCILHSAALAMGVVIQSVDKPYYDPADTYSQRHGEYRHELVVPDGEMLLLLAAKFPTRADIRAYPHMAYELLNVNFFVLTDQLEDLGVFPPIQSCPPALVGLVAKKST